MPAPTALWTSLTTYVHGVNIDDMTHSRDAYHHGDLRNALVASAVRLIERDGPADFSLREAARDNGVSANAAYRHFDDKAALMTAAAADGFVRLAQRMQQAMDRVPMRSDVERPSVARFKAVGRAYVEFATDHPELFRVMFGACGVECVKGEPGDADGGAPWALLGRSLDALVADGVMPSDRRPDAELKAWTVVHGLASLLLDGIVATPRRRERTAMLESLLDFAVVGLCGRVRTSTR